MKSHPSAGFVVCHRMPGRLRIKSRAVRSRVPDAMGLEDWLKSRADVREVSVRPRTGSVVVRFDPSADRSEHLVKLLKNRLGDIREVSNQAVCKPRHHCWSERAGGFPGKLVFRLAHLAALTGVVGYCLTRGYFLKSPVYQAPGSPLSLVTGIGTAPVLYQGWRDVRRGRWLSLYPFLGAASVLGIALGEAFTTLEILWIQSLGSLLEDYVADRSRRAIRKVIAVSDRNAFVRTEEGEAEVPVSQICSGDHVVVRSTEKIAVDGVVVEGEALVDESSITGRADPELRKADDFVYAGTIVQQGLIVVLARKVGEDTYLAHIARLVEDSLANRAPAEKRADLLAARLMRLGVVVTLGSYAVTGNAMQAFTVMLLMACPCATVLAASTAVTAALAAAARHHMLVKGGLYLERLSRAQCFCFDKTGTLTTGEPQVAVIAQRSQWQTPDQILSLAAAAETHNPHPVARAIVHEAEAQGAEISPDAQTEIVLGRGVRARLGENEILVGNARFMEEEDVSIKWFGKKADRQLQQGHTVLYVARDGKAQAMIGLASSLRPGAEATMSRLRRDGVRSLHLITGDTEAVAARLSDALGMDGFRAGLLPREKADYVEELGRSGSQVVMVGDGINDALALTTADIGVAVGAGGAEVALQAADIALMDSDLAKLAALRLLSRKTLRIIEQNFWLAISTNLLGSALALSGRLTPVMGGVLHIAHTLGIMANSARLTGWKPPATEL